MHHPGDSPGFQGGQVMASISRRPLDDQRDITCMRKATAIANTIDVYGIYATMCMEIM